MTGALFALPDKEPCGVQDRSAVVLAPVHSDCRGCRKVILSLSTGRVPMAGGPPRNQARAPEDRGINADSLGPYRMLRLPGARRS